MSEVNPRHERVGGARPRVENEAGMRSHLGKPIRRAKRPIAINRLP